MHRNPLTLWSQGGFVGQAGNADIAYDIFAYLGMVQDYAAGIADGLTAGAFTKWLNAQGLSWAVDTSSEAYRYGTYTGQALVLVAAVLQPEVGMVLGLLQAAGCLANVAQALQQGNYGQAAGWAAAALVALVPYISACQVGAAVGKVLAQAAGETVGAVAAQGANLLTRGIGLYGAVTSTVTAIEQFRNGDIVGGLLSLGNAALDLYSATRSCFTAEMLLDTADGKKRADTIELGDRLWSRNENDPTGPCELKEVEAVFVREAPVWNVHVAGQLIRTTAEHPFWVSGRGWIAACGLRIGDLVSTRDGRLVPVEGVADSGAVETVYNWRVADFHTYFVGDSSWGFSVWAHNACHVDATPESRTVGKQFRGRAEELWNTLPNRRRFGATVAVTEVNGQQVVSLYANVGRGQRQFSQTQINSFRATVEDAGGVFIHTSGNVHAEQALHQAYGSAPAIGISNYNGPCPACGRYFQQQGYFNLFWPDR